MKSRSKLLIIRLTCFTTAFIFAMIQLDYTLPLAFALIGMGWGTFFQIRDDEK